MANLERYRALLRSARPDLSPTRFAYLGEGWDNILFDIDDERIVRFAKDARTSRLLETEAALLQAIGPALPVPVPRPEYVGRTPSAPDVAFMIYRRLPGLPLDRVPLDDVLIAGIAPALARMLEALHGMSPDLLSAIEIPRFTPENWVERHRTLHRQTRDDVRQGLSRPAFKRYEVWWRDYLADPASRAFQPCFIHGDLALEHLLVEPDPWRLSGVIDFGDAMWADAALDLAGWPDLLARAVVAQIQTVTLSEAFWTRRAAYRQIAPLHAVFAGQELGRPELRHEGIGALRRFYDTSAAGEL